MSDQTLAAAWYQPPPGGRMRQSRDKEVRQPAEPAGPKLVEVLPLDDGILMLHFDEGHVVHHQRGMARSDNVSLLAPSI